MKQFLVFTLIFSIVCFLSCAATVIPRQVDELKKKCNPYLGQTTRVFLQNNPGAEVTVIDIDSNQFRYSFRERVACSFEEALLAPTRVTNRCWIDVYFFSEKGIIVRYSMQRGRLY